MVKKVERFVFTFVKYTSCLKHMNIMTRCSVQCFIIYLNSPQYRNPYGVYYYCNRYRQIIRVKWKVIEKVHFGLVPLSGSHIEIE